MSKKCIVYTSANVLEASLVKGLLESNGVSIFIYDDNISRLNPFYTSAVGGVKLVVDESQLERAKEVLQEYLGKDEKSPNYGQISPFETILKEPEEAVSKMPSGKTSNLKCRKCHSIQEPDAQYCDQCGEPL